MTARNAWPDFEGYRREDGRVGVRNWVLAVPTVLCASRVCERVAAALPDRVAALPHLAGCGQLGPDRDTTHRTLAAYCRHPNVGAVVVVALGCEQLQATALAREAERVGKPSSVLTIQESGGTPRTTDAGIALAEGFARELRSVARQPIAADQLILALECGGSDYSSGLAANPVLGRVSDRLTERGGAVVLSETAEILGAEHLLAARAERRVVSERLHQIVGRVEAEANRLGLDIRGTQPSPGNIRGGLTTIEEKALGATAKGGERSRLEDVVDYASPITRRGLTVMDTPGFDVESVTGKVAGGAQVVVFTTGLGTPTGNPIAPVIKVTANPRTAEGMAVHVDLDLSPVLAGDETLDEGADRLQSLILEVCSGRETAAEGLGHREFAMHRRNPTI